MATGYLLVYPGSDEDQPVMVETHAPEQAAMAMEASLCRDLSCTRRGKMNGGKAQHIHVAAERFEERARTYPSEDKHRGKYYREARLGRGVTITDHNADQRRRREVVVYLRRGQVARSPFQG